MNKDKFKDTLKIAFLILCLFGALVYSLLTKNYKFIFGISICFMLIGISYLILFFTIFKYTKTFKKIKKTFEYLENKSNKTIFENVFILAYQEKFDELIKQSLETNKIKEVLGVNVEIININKILIICRYQGFQIKLSLKKDLIEYLIDSPARYDGLKENISIEKNIKRELNYSQFIDINDLLNYIVNLIIECQENINDFINNNVMDPLFNGRLIEKLSSYLTYLKKNGLLLVILTIPLTIFFGYGLAMCFIDTDFNSENNIGFYVALICCISIIVFSICSFIIGIKMLTTRIKFKKDFKQKNISVIKESPYKVRIVQESLYRSNCSYIRNIVLYFKNLTLIIPYSSSIIKNNKNIRKCCSECKKLKIELKYLTKSKIIISGERSYLNIIKKYLFK